jgi:hypothetical protein
MRPRRVLLSVGIACLLVGAVAGFLYGLESTPTKTSTSFSTTTVQTIPDAYDQVASSYANHLLLLDSANTSALMDGYAGNATVEWKGNSGGCDGNYTGTGEIVAPLMALLANDSQFVVNNETQTITPAGSHWVVESSFVFAGSSNPNKNATSPYLGIFDGTIDAKDSYVSVGHAWLITDETWNFLLLDTTFLDRGIPVEC